MRSRKILFGLIGLFICSVAFANPNPKFCLSHIIKLQERNISHDPVVIERMLKQLPLFPDEHFKQAKLSILEHLANASLDVQDAHILSPNKLSQAETFSERYTDAEFLEVFLKKPYTLYPLGDQLHEVAIQLQHAKNGVLPNHIDYWHAAVEALRVAIDVSLDTHWRYGHRLLTVAHTLLDKAVTAPARAPPPDSSAASYGKSSFHEIFFELATGLDYQSRQPVSPFERILAARQILTLADPVPKSLENHVQRFIARETFEAYLSKLTTTKQSFQLNRSEYLGLKWLIQNDGARFVAHILEHQPELASTIGTLIHKAEVVTIVKAAEANAFYVGKDFHPPHNPSFDVLVIQNAPGISVYRVWGGAAAERGAFAFLESPQKRDKAETRRIHAVPPSNTMEHVVQANLQGADVNLSVVNPHPDWGEGGALQVELRTYRPPESWSESEPWSE